MANVRLSHQGLKVLRLFVGAPTKPVSGAEIAKAVRIGSGTLYPLLARLEEAGWLASQWEDIEPVEAGRPRRRLYLLTGLGHRSALAALADVAIDSGSVQWAL